MDREVRAAIAQEALERANVDADLAKSALSTTTRIDNIVAYLGKAEALAEARQNLVDTQLKSLTEHIATLNERLGSLADTSKGAHEFAASNLARLGNLLLKVSEESKIAIEALEKKIPGGIG